MAGQSSQQQHTVLVSVAGRDEPLTVRVPSGNTAVEELKRAVLKATGIQPEEQRVEVQAGVDDFAFPTRLSVVRRVRKPVFALEVHTFNYTSVRLDVDPQDTVLDVKFLLSDKLAGGVLPEHIVLYLDKQTRLPNQVPLHTCGALKKGASVFMQFEFPSGIEGHGHVHRTAPQILSVLDASVCNLGTNFRVACRKFRKNKMYGMRDFCPDGERGAYRWLTYEQVERRVNNIAAALAQLGLGRGDSVGLISKNRTEWQVVDNACYLQSLCSVPLYDTFGEAAIEYIVQQADVRIVFTSVEHLSEIAAIRASCPKLEFVVLIDGSPDEIQFANQNPKQQAGYTHTMSELEQLGARFPVADVLPSGDEVATLCYTSGTTGMPKGVILTHSNLLSGAQHLSTRMPPDLVLPGEECIMSYLPLAHIYERVLEIGMMGLGCSVGFFQGDNTKLVDDIVALQPSFVPGVPRVWQKIHDKISLQVEEGGAIKQWLFNQGFKAKQAGESKFWDSLVFSKVAAKFGGRIKLITSGSAPISNKVVEFLRIALSVQFGEGYGLSETCAALTTTDLGDTEMGHVGTPLPCCEVKLVDVPDMNYLTTDKPCPRGEIWVRGSSVFQGYFKQADKTDEVLTQDGWFQTGDVGLWTQSGKLKIIDRKKNIFKLSQGEYIRPEMIEGVCKQSKFVANVFVYGDSTQRFLVAIVVPDFDVLASWAPQHGLAEIANNPAELAKSDKVRAVILSSIKNASKAEKLRGFEVIKKIHLESADFTIESGLLTPSMKLKRHQAKLKFKPIIDTLYAEINSKL